MAFDLRLVDGDIVVDPFDIQLNEPGLEAVGQRLAINLRAFQGEYFLDTGFGTPWFQNIFVKNPSLNLVDTLIKRVITGTEGVLQLLSYTSAITTDRCLTLQFRARVEDDIIDAELQPGVTPVLCIYQAPPGNNVIFQFPLGSPVSATAANLDFNCDD